MDIAEVTTIVGLIISILSILLAYFAFKRNEKNDTKKEGKSEGLILSDIGYIKACVDRMEKNLNKVDENYEDIIVRIVRLEESNINISKKIEEMTI